MTLKQAIDKVTSSLVHKGDFDGILFSIVDGASRYYVDCPEDFCLQTISHKAVVFGGTNRLIWTGMNGFLPDRSYCTEKFLRRCATLGDLPRGQ